MPVNEFGMNDDFVSYFPLEEYVDKIRVLPYVGEHLEEICIEFDKYIKLLKDNFSNEQIADFFASLTYQELKNNHSIEHDKFKDSLLLGKDIWYDKLGINNQRIHELHNFAMGEDYEPTFEYRHTPVEVSGTMNGKKALFFRGANPEDVAKFMNDFIKISKQSGSYAIYSSPFISSALLHLLFVRIHPYTDGNGRTARIIHNIRFTKKVNETFGKRLKLCPLNISGRILDNKVSYTKFLNQVTFNLKDNNNEAINKWFDFILNMYDEELYFSLPRLEELVRLEDKKFYIPEDKVRRMHI